MSSLSFLTGITEDGKIILLVEMVKIKNQTIRAAAQSNTKFALGCKNGVLFLRDLDLTRKVQAALNISCAEKCVITFIHGTNDIEYIMVDKDEEFWSQNISKIQSFFEAFVKYIILKNIKVN